MLVPQKVEAPLAVPVSRNPEQCIWVVRSNPSALGDKKVHTRENDELYRIQDPQ